ncbi:MAG TPA: hypothetical protein ACHBX0_08305 [Arsenophonus sp.]
MAIDYVIDFTDRLLSLINVKTLPQRDVLASPVSYLANVTIMSPFMPLIPVH